jgi:hypothetical protein
VARQNIAWGRGEDTQKLCLSLETAYIRQRLGSAIVTCFGDRLVSRMSQVGNGAVLAAARRYQWGREEEQARAMRNAAWIATVSGVSWCSSGPENLFGFLGAKLLSSWQHARVELLHCVENVHIQGILLNYGKSILPSWQIDSFLEQCSRAPYTFQALVFLSGGYAMLGDLWMCG